MVVSLPIMFFLIFRCVLDSNYFVEASVIPPQHVLQGHKMAGLDRDAVHLEQARQVVPELKM